jgi:spermidine synthase
LLINILACWFFYANLLKKYFKSAVLISSCLALVILVFSVPQKLQSISVSRQWKQGNVIDYKNSVFGNIVVLKKTGQFTFYYNGIPVVTQPHPDMSRVWEFGHLPLLFQGSAKDILIIGDGAGGLIAEILKHRVRKIDYVELDPELINMFKKYPAGSIKEELSDKG